MAKKKHLLKKFETASQMDDFLESHDLGEYFKARGKIKKASLTK